MPKLLITGASGYLGWHLSQIAQASWQVHGSCFSQPHLPTGVIPHIINLTDAAAAQAWLAALRPDAVIHAAAQSKPNRCEQDPAAAHAINVEATATIAAYCSRANIPALFTSTDLVFDGQAAPYDETAQPAPVNLYGRQKVAAEAAFSAAHPAGVICRLPLMFGGPTPVASSFLQPFLAQLQQRQPLSLFTDEYRTPAWIEDVAQGLLLALNQTSTVLHLGGPERLSRHQFGLQLAAAFGIDPALIWACRQADLPMAASRPADVSLRSDRAFDLGYAPRSPLQALQILAARSG